MILKEEELYSINVFTKIVKLTITLNDSINHLLLTITDSGVPQINNLSSAEDIGILPQSNRYIVVENNNIVIGVLCSSSIFAKVDSNGDGVIDSNDSSFKIMEIIRDFYENK